MYTSTEIIIYLLLALVILIGLFLVLRELNCWYWKINERIKLQKEILLYLKKLAQPEAIENKIINNDSSSDTDEEHRLIYRCKDDEILIAKCRFHYDG